MAAGATASVRRTCAATPAGASPGAGPGPAVQGQPLPLVAAQLQPLCQRAGAAAHRAASTLLGESSGGSGSNGSASEFDNVISCGCGISRRQQRQRRPTRQPPATPYIYTAGVAPALHKQQAAPQLTPRATCHVLQVNRLASIAVMLHCLLPTTWVPPLATPTVVPDYIPTGEPQGRPLQPAAAAQPRPQGQAAPQQATWRPVCCCAPSAAAQRSSTHPCSLLRPRRRPATAAAPGCASSTSKRRTVVRDLSRQRLLAPNQPASDDLEDEQTTRV